jgi:hypothetical protein
MAIGDLARAAGLTVYEGTQDARYGYQNDNQRGDDIAKLGTDLRRTLREDYAQLSDGGERFMSRLQMGLDVRLGIAGDSLSTEMDEYPALLAEWIVSLYPNIRCLFSRWNGAGYDTETLNEGTPTAPRATRMLRDDFSKVVADVYGSTPDNMGGAWGRNGVNTSGDWSSAGAGAVASNETARGFLLWGTGSNGTQDIETRIVLPAGNPAATTAFRVYTRYANAANHTYLSIDVRAAGTYVVTWVTVRDGVATVRADLPAVAIPANRTLDIRLIVGPTVRFIVNAQSLTTTLNSLDIEATTGGSGSSVGFGTTGSGLAGLTVKYFEAGISRSLTYQYLYVYNAGRASTTWQYQIDNAAAMYPVGSQLDLMIACSSHNNFPDNPSLAPSDPAGYIEKAEELVRVVQALHPDTGWIFASQNPERFPVGAAAMDAHQLRQAALAAWARQRNFGYAAGYEAFTARNSALNSLIEPDGIHPRKTTGEFPGGGAVLLAQTMIAVLALYLVKVA